MFALLPSRTVALQILGFSIHWYGLLYLAAFLLTWLLLPRLQRYRRLSLSADAWSGLLSWAVVGVIVGGRLGYVLFYDPQTFLVHPLRIIAVWEGGMSFHGGFIGATLALLFAERKSAVARILSIGDLISIPAALGLILGRVGNLINQELYGPATNLPWGVAIPGLKGLRHPTPLYEGIYSLIIALLCFLYLRRSSVAGRTWALFALLYAIFRSLTEFLRVQEYATFVAGPLVLTRGQLLNIPVLLLGILLWWWAGRRSGA